MLIATTICGFLFIENIRAAFLVDNFIITSSTEPNTVTTSSPETDEIIEASINSSTVIIEENYNSSTIQLTTTTIISSNTVMTFEVLLEASSNTSTISTTTINTTTKAVDWLSISINEIVSNPTSNGEWVELYNSNTSSQDLTGASICDNTLKNCKYISSTINGLGYLVIELQTNRYLNNDFDSVILRDDSDSVIDKIDYGDYLLAPNKDQSLSKENSQWYVTDVITKNSNNIIQTAEEDIVEEEVVVRIVSNTTTSNNNLVSSQCSDCKNTGNIILYSIYPNPVGQDNEGEYISIKNLSEDKINLNGWKIKDLSKEYRLSGIIDEDQIIQYDRVSTSIALNNTTAEMITLIDSSNNVIDVVGYNKANEGEVYIKKDDEWIWIKQYGVGGYVVSSTENQPDNVNTIFTTTATEESTSTNSTSSKKLEVQYLPLSLFQARQVNKEEKILISGIVIVLPNIFGSQYLYISENGSGIQVYSYSKNFPDLEIGDYIEVKGEISYSFNVPRIKIQDQKDIKIIAKNQKLPMVSSTISKFNENHFGALVKTTGIITELKSTHMYIDDNEDEIKIYFKPNANIKKDNYELKQEVEVIGILEKANDKWHIMPRSGDDIQIKVSDTKTKQVDDNTIKITSTIQSNVSDYPDNNKSIWVVVVLLASTIMFLIFLKRKEIFNKQKIPFIKV